MSLPDWAVPGVFLICTATGWQPRGLHEPLRNPPLVGRIYTLAGAIPAETYGEALAILAEYPHNAMSLKCFKPVPLGDIARFRLLLSPAYAITDADTYVDAYVTDGQNAGNRRFVV